MDVVDILSMDTWVATVVEVAAWEVVTIGAFNVLLTEVITVDDCCNCKVDDEEASATVDGKEVEEVEVTCWTLE